MKSSRTKMSKVYCGDHELIASCELPNAHIGLLGRARLNTIKAIGIKTPGTEKWTLIKEKGTQASYRKHFKDLIKLFIANPQLIVVKSKRKRKDI